MEVDDDVNADEVETDDEPEPEPEPAAAAAAGGGGGGAVAPGGEVTQPLGKYPMTPAVRRILKENNLVPAQIAPTGKNGQ